MTRRRTETSKSVRIENKDGSGHEWGKNSTTGKTEKSQHVRYAANGKAYDHYGNALPERDR